MGTRRRFFALIELFITLSIVVLIGGVLVVKAGPMLRRYQQEQSLAKLEREILLSQRIAEGARAEVVFELHKDKEGIVCIRKVEEPLTMPGVFGKKIHCPHLEIPKNVRILTFFPEGLVAIDGEIQEKNTPLYPLGREKKSERVQ